VPAKVQGVWHLASGELTLQQEYHALSGTLTSGANVTKIAAARMRGDQIQFSADGAQYLGRVDGNSMEGTVTIAGRTANWKAVR